MGPGKFLTTLMEQAARNGISILFDLHAMPCGSSDGTYNGIYPNKCTFYSEDSSRQLGLDVVSNMMQWWEDLPTNLKAAVHGFTVLNEPGLGMVYDLPGGNTTIVSWLKEAVQVFEGYALEGAAEGVEPPLLYLNLHESAFPGDALPQMAEVYQNLGLSGKNWAVFDVHHYFSWGGDQWNGVPAVNCSTDAELTKWVNEEMDNWTKNMKATAKKYNIKNLASSEWSLSLHHKDHIHPCTAENPLDIMHDLQKQWYEDNGIGHFFWGWRMPTGGTHEPMWSLKYHYTGKH